MGLIKVLKEKGYEILIIAPRDEYSQKLEQEKIPYRHITIDNKGTNPFKDIYLTFDFYKIFKREKPHLILSYTIKPNIYGSIAAHFLNIPVVNNITGLGTLFIKANWLTKIAEYLYRHALRQSEKVFFLNNDDMHYFLRKKIIKKPQAEILPGTGIDHKKFVPYPVIKTNSRFTFLLSARMIWVKGIETYVEAARILRDKYENIEFQLLGFTDVQNPTAISREKIQEWVDAGIVNYLGETDNVIDYILRADCVVLPSYREGLPRSLLEAASLAKPIITTNCSGCRDVVDDGFNGYLCTPNNALDLAEKMDRMINLSDNERSLMGLRGREKMIKEFDETIVIRRYLDTVSL